MIWQGRLLVCLIAGATALNPPGHDELLRNALNAVIRKQRSLDIASPEYYNDLHAFKYHGNPDRNFKRERQGDREIDEEEEEIEFLPNETGQLETVGNGFQGLNDKLLERAWMESFKNVPEDEEPVREPSIFRERERSSSRKRGSNNEQMNIANKILADFFLVKLQDGSPYTPGEMDDEEYLNTLQMLYDRYKGRGRKFYDNEGPVLLDELGNKATLIRDQNREVDENELADRDQDQSVLYLSPAERRNVNGRYPIGRDFGTYRSLVKRYPVTKRSPKMLSTKKQSTDPKVAQDLGALFGTQSTDGQNHTHDHDHEHEHDHNHDHDHKHDHDRNDQRNTSEAPKVTPLAKGQKENATKIEKSKSIEVRKKSVDWSQYFGIDRRRKKATFMAGQGTQNQDDEWMLQRYYENMAENLRPSEREYEKDGNERKDKFEQLDPRMLTEDSLRYGDSEQAAYLQKVKDKIIARLAAAYSLEKMRKALSDLKSNLAAGLEAQKVAQAPNNLTWNYRDNGSVGRTDDKRSGSVDERPRARVEIESFEEGEACPELAAIERRCKPDTLSRDGTQLLHLPCTMLQICRACLHNELAHKACLGVYALEVDGICAAQKFRKGQKAKEICDSTAFNLSLLQPPASVAELCRSNGNDSCLRRYHELRYPYGGGRLNASDALALQQMDR